MCTECAISAYRDLAPIIFKRSHSRKYGSKLTNPIFGRPWYKAEPFEKAVLEVIQNCLFEPKKFPLEEEEKIRYNQDPELKPSTPCTGSGKMYERYG
jgi:hypothetical protein